MYKSVRIARIVVSLIALAVPTWALIAGYSSVFVRMQILTSIITGSAVCLIFWLLVTLIYGRIYCSTVCPMGTFMDCVSGLSRVVRRCRHNYVFSPPAPRTRIVFLIITFVSLLVGTSLLPTIFDPYTAYARMIEELLARPFGHYVPAIEYAGVSLALAIITAMLVTFFALRHGRIICNTVCPVGTILSVGSRRSFFHIEIDPDRCINCGECERVCKSQCIKVSEHIVDTARCVVCFNCTSICPSGAINYKSGRYRLSMPMMQTSAQSRTSLSVPQNISGGTTEASSKIKVKK